MTEILFQRRYPPAKMKREEGETGRQPRSSSYRYGMDSDSGGLGRIAETEYKRAQGEGKKKGRRGLQTLKKTLLVGTLERLGQFTRDKGGGEDNTLIISAANSLLPCGIYTGNGERKRGGEDSACSAI